jgi:prefoldin subunit 5
MPLDPTSLSESVSASFRELSSAAESLNSVSDALSKAVADIDDGLKKLNLGIEAWVSVCAGTDHRDATYWSRDLGYAKVNGKWGIALREVEGSHVNDDHEIEEWLFNDAARSSRLEAIKKIPELLSKLQEEAAKVTKMLQTNLVDAQAVAAAVQGAAAVPKVKGFMVKGAGGFTPPPAPPKSVVKP